MTPAGIVGAFRKIGKGPCRDYFYDFNPNHCLITRDSKEVIARAKACCGLVAVALARGIQLTDYQCEHHMIGQLLGIGYLATRSFAMGWDGRLDFYEKYMRVDPVAARWARLGEAAWEAMSPTGLAGLDPVVTI